MKYVNRFSTLLIVLVSATALAGHNNLIPAEHRPAKRGAYPATGRSGSATLNARALLGANGVTTLEVTTAPSFEALPPGNIDKLQVKLEHGGENKVQNFNHLSEGGSLNLPLEGLFRHDEMQIQANVSGIDGHRTDVVTVQTSVQLRPDLAITLIAPAEAPVNEPVTLTAVVTELNGDLDADTTIVLSLDGQSVDRARLLHVFPGETTTANFAHVFTTTGPKLLQLSTVTVEPGDYDESNNSDSALIEVVSNSLPFRRFTLDVRQDEVVQETRQVDDVRDVTKSISNLVSTAVFTGYVPALNLQRTNVAVEHFSGSLDCGAEFKLTPATTSKGWFSISSNGHALVITSNPANLEEHKIQASRSSSRNTYFSEGWSYLYAGKEGTYYAINEEYHPAIFTGSQGRYGSSYDFRIVVSDGEKVYEANPIAGVTTQIVPLSKSDTCSLGEFGTFCTHKEVTYFKTRGFAEQKN